MEQRNRRSTAPLIVALLSAILLVPGCGRSAPPAVGVSSSGAFLDAARLALQDASQPAPFDTLFVADQGSRPAPAIGTARRFAALPGMMAVIGHSNSGASLAASQIYNAERVVQIAPTTSAEVYSEAGPFSFRLVPPDRRQSAFLAAQLVRMRPAGARIAILYVNDDYGRGLRDGLLVALDTTLFEQVVEIPHLDARADSATIARSIRTLTHASPDLLLWLGRADVLNRYLPEIRRGLGGIVVVGSDAVAEAAHLAPDPALWDNVVFPEIVRLDATPELRDFRERYRRRFHNEPTSGDALSYDAMSLVLAGAAAGARTGPQLRRYLMSLGRERPPFRGLTGPIAFDENGDVERDYLLSAPRGP